MIVVLPLEQRRLVSSTARLLGYKITGGAYLCRVVSPDNRTVVEWYDYLIDDDVALSQGAVRFDMKVKYHISFDNLEG